MTWLHVIPVVACLPSAAFDPTTEILPSLSNSAPGLGKSLNLRLVEAKRILSRSIAAASVTLSLAPTVGYS